MRTVILTHDMRWKGLRPTVTRAVEAVLFASSSRPRAGISGSGGRALKEIPARGRDDERKLNDKSAAANSVRTGDDGKAGGSAVMVTVVLADDGEVRRLNANYRKKDKPTNVLSFSDGAVENGVTQLGDIILAYETVAQEASEQGKTLKAHVTHLVIHGVLHLMGFDHMTEEEAKAMESLEIRILARMGIANPYASS